MSMPSSLTLQSTVVITQEVLSSDVDDETILLSIVNSKYYGMANTGSRIWSLLKKPITVRKIVDTLLAEYEVDEDQCKVEVIAFLQELLSEKLISTK